METLPRSLLVNFWYAHPVGHAVEALRYCLGHTNDGVEVSLLLNGATATELGSCAPFIRETYAVEEQDPPPHGRIHFFSAASIGGNVIFLAIILLTGIATIVDRTCHQA